MNRCQECGKNLTHDATFCPACGTKIERDDASFKTFDYTHPSDKPNYSNYGSQSKVKFYPSNDNPSHFAGAISCCFPIVGLVLYFVWKDDKPNSAQLVCNWMIAGFVAWFVLYFFTFILGIAGM